MTRITDSQTQRSLVSHTLDNKRDLNRYSEQVTTGLKVNLPGDTSDAGTISRYQQTLKKIESYTTAVAQAKNMLEFQDDVMNQMNELIIRAKEVATQGANETLSVSARAHLAEEIFQLRDHVVSLANSTFQGSYIYGGSDDDDPPIDETTFTNPATGEARRRFVFDGDLGASVQKNIDLTDNLTLTLTTPGTELFNTTIEALQRLGRSLAGYASDPTAGTLTGAGNAYSLPTDYAVQTADIQNAIGLLNQARENDILPERVSLGGRMRRIETAESLLTLTRNSAEDVLGRIRDADPTESAANLSQAQTALEASYTVTAKVLRISILDYI
jgi:flagellar hook-associated protein 3 FlgL